MFSDNVHLQMEQFSRECLEVETEVNDGRPDVNLGTSMDKVYDRAAKLVKRTLDVEGVLVMDVPHCEVIESMSGDGGVSITMHHGDQGMDMTRRQLTTEEGRNLMMFFEKYPEGRISEGIVPQSFKPFLPTRVQYALSEYNFFFPIGLKLGDLVSSDQLCPYLISISAHSPYFVHTMPLAMLSDSYDIYHGLKFLLTTRIA